MAVPATWATTKDVMAHLQISERTWSRMKRSWIDAGYMKKGKHYFEFSKRTIRYDIDEIRKLAHRMGRVTPVQG